MDRAKWTSIGLEVAEHLKALKEIAVKNDIPLFDVAAFKDGFSWAAHIDSDGIHWNVDLCPDGTTRLTANGTIFFEE